MRKLREAKSSRRRMALEDIKLPDKPAHVGYYRFFKSHAANRTVIKLLNGKQNAQAKRISSFIEECHRVWQMMEAMKVFPTLQQAKELRTACGGINARLLKYRWRPNVAGAIAGEPVFLVTHSIFNEHADALVKLEHDSLEWILQNMKLVHRIRRCEVADCNKWFWAETDHQKFHAPNCRQHNASKSEAFKEQRRKYMKKYRESEAAKDEKAKRLVRGK